MKFMVSLNHDEMGNLPYQFLCTTRESAVWNTARRRRAWKEQFTESERAQAEKIF